MNPIQKNVFIEWQIAWYSKQTTTKKIIKLDHRALMWPTHTTHSLTQPHKNKHTQSIHTITFSIDKSYSASLRPNRTEPIKTSPNCNLYCQYWWAKYWKNRWHFYGNLFTIDKWKSNQIRFPDINQSTHREKKPQTKKNKWNDMKKEKMKINAVKRIKSKQNIFKKKNMWNEKSNNLYWTKKNEDKILVKRFTKSEAKLAVG